MQAVRTTICAIYIEGELSVGRIVLRLGANCPEIGGELSGANCPDTLLTLVFLKNPCVCTQATRNG